MRLWITDRWDDWRSGGGIVVLDVSEVDFEAWRQIDRCDLLQIPSDVFKPWRGRDVFRFVEVRREHWHLSESEAREAIRAETVRREREAKRALEKATALRRRVATEGAPMARTIDELRAERRAKAGPRPPRKPSGCPIPRADGSPCTVGIGPDGMCRTHANMLYYSDGERWKEMREALRVEDDR